MRLTHTTNQSKEPKDAQSTPRQHLFILPDQAGDDHQHDENQPREEGLYELVRQDQLLRSYHTARLRNTPGYEHLSEEAAASMVEQMLSLVTLICEMTMGQANQNAQPDYLPFAA